MIVLLCPQIIFGSMINSSCISAHVLKTVYFIQLYIMVEHTMQFGVLFLTFGACTSLVNVMLRDRKFRQVNSRRPWGVFHQTEVSSKRLLTKLVGTPNQLTITGILLAMTGYEPRNIQGPIGVYFMLLK
jgi:hypothetical protein